MLDISEVNFNAYLPHILRWGLLPKAFTTYSDLSALQNDPYIEQFLNRYLKTYASTYLQEEIQREAQLRKLDAFSRLLEFAAMHNGEPVNQRKASLAAGVHAETAKEYYEMLVDTLIAYEIPPWTYSASEKMQLASKYYLFDTGVINALCDELGSACKPGTYRFGKLFESLVVTEIIKQLRKTNSSKKIFHYRTDRGHEINLILQKNARSEPTAIEIKSSDAPDISDVKHLVNFKKRYKNAKCFVLCLTPRAYEIEGIEFLPYLEGITRASLT